MQDPLSCDLTEIQDRGKDSYEALSYTWTEGDETDSERTDILCHESPLSITLHLASALSQIRDEFQTKSLWIDQICINQGDSDEKDSQIRLMGQIYSNANKVLIWLGSASEDSDLAMDSVPTLIEDLKRLDSVDRTPSQVLSGDWGLSTEQSKALNRLFNRRWFSRVWTLQEAALGVSSWILCGEKCIDFSLLLFLSQRSQDDGKGHWKEAVNEIAVAIPPKAYNERYVMFHVHTIGKMREHEAQHSQHIEEPLFMILNRISTCGCTDNRDRIYALFHFLPESVRHSLEAKSKYSEYTPESLYRTLAAIELVEIGELSFLSAAGICRQRLQVPSWVPDWTFKPRQHSFTLLHYDCLNKGHRSLYQAGTARQKTTSPRTSADGAQLFVQGRMLGMIIDHASPFQFAISSSRGSNDASAILADATNLISERLSQVNSCVALAERHQPLDTEPDFKAACHRTLVAGLKAPGGGSTISVLVPATDADIKLHFDALSDSHKTFTDWSLAAKTSAFVQSLMVEFQTSGLSLKDYIARLKETMAERVTKTHNLANGALALIQDACKSRVFFVMKKANDHKSPKERKFIGLAPENAKTDDIICVIYGCPAPMLLRKLEPDGDLENDQTRYQLLGECYVDGFMHGEASEMLGLVDEEIMLV